MSNRDQDDFNWLELAFLLAALLVLRVMELAESAWRRASGVFRHVA